jgi:hypothetical protein
MRGLLLWGLGGGGEQVGKLFQIILNKTVALKDVKIAGRDGELLQCWDLFVGQKIDVLGKPTTLMQANHATLMWLEFHARRLLKKALELENEIMQFKPIPDIVHRMLNTRVRVHSKCNSSTDQQHSSPSPRTPCLLRLDSDRYTSEGSRVTRALQPRQSIALP